MASFWRRFKGQVLIELKTGSKEKRELDEEIAGNSEWDSNYQVEETGRFCTSRSFEKSETALQISATGIVEVPASDSQKAGKFVQE